MTPDIQSAPTDLIFMAIWNKHQHDILFATKFVGYKRQSNMIYLLYTTYDIVPISKIKI